MRGRARQTAAVVSAGFLTN